jgi:GNAT superfamily N-acetyltransferase
VSQRGAAYLPPRHAGSTMPADRVRIRRATVDDADAIASTFTEAARAAWRHIAPPDRLDALEPAPEQWVERLRRPVAGDEVLVAAVDDEVVGFIWVRARTDETSTGEVATFYTRPRVWGSGVGRALLDAGVRVLRDAGCQEATLWTEERNHRPRRVYEAYGWHTDGATNERTYLDAPIRDVRYRLTL